MHVCRIFSHDNILPLLAVIVEPHVHTVSMYMRLGSLYNVLHNLESGNCNHTDVHLQLPQTTLITKTEDELLTSFTPFVCTTVSL